MRGQGAVPKWLIFAHRWMGIVLCMFFLLWFCSGTVMIFSDFPSVSPADRLERASALAARSIRFSPMEAYRKLGRAEGPEELRLNTFDGRPVYRFRFGDGEKVVYADSGEEQREVSTPMMQRIAGGWSGQSASAARVEELDDVDQWTLQGPVRRLAPLWKFSWPNGDQLYVSGQDGEVAQFTTKESRLWAYLGPIPHWLYFAPLRRHQQSWSKFVMWCSGLATISVVLGLAIAVSIYSPRKRYRHNTSSSAIPYRGWKRWHTIVGLLFGLTAASWAFSGFLSMEPFGTGTRASTDDALSSMLRSPLEIAAFAAKSPDAALGQLGQAEVKQLEFISVSGEPAYLVTLAHAETRIVPVHGEPIVSYPASKIAALVRNAVASMNIAEIGLLTRYDAYYRDRRGRKPLPVIRTLLNDDAHTRYYIDPKTADLAGAYRSSDWVNRWLYHGFHSLDFPWLSDHWLLWNAIMFAGMLGGTALSITGMFMAWRVLVRIEPGGSGKAKIGRSAEKKPERNPAGS